MFPDGTSMILCAALGSPSPSLQRFGVSCLQHQSYPARDWVPHQQLGRCSGRISRNTGKVLEKTN